MTSHSVYIGNCVDLKDSYTKCGKTSNFINRRGQLQTSYPLNEFVPYIIIMCCNVDDESAIEELIHSQYYEHNTIHNENYKGTGIEWFDYTFNYDEIKDLLENNGYYNKILIDLELVNYLSVLKRKHYNKDNYINKMKLLKDERLNKYSPNDIQFKILENIEHYYSNNNIGKLLAACGVGKTLASLFISKKLKFRTILIGVPYSNLLDQWKNEITKLYSSNDILLVGGNGTTNLYEIKEFLELTTRNRIIITTYSSSHTIQKLTEEIEFVFNFKVGDEAHHLASREANSLKQWISFHKIKSDKTLFLTATEKNIEDKTNKIVYSMDDEEIFGKNIYPPISIKWAIDTKKITDYQVILLKNTEEQVYNIIKILGVPIENKGLFISAYVSLKSIVKYIDLTHILIYCNKTNNAKLITKYINLILEKNLVEISKEDLYYIDLHSDSSVNKDTCIDDFKTSKYGIINCVYEFGEGFNCPEINGVVFSENMESEIRICQCSLRANRLDSNFPNKIAYYMIPWIDTDNWGEDKTPFDKVKKIISKLGNEDGMIQQKIVLSELKPKKPKKPKTENDDDGFILDDDDNELNKIILRLKHKKSLKSRCSQEEDELNYIRELNKQLNISDKHHYLTFEKTHAEFIKDPDAYFIKHGLWKGWNDFLGIDTTNFILSKEEWIKFCQEKKVDSVNKYNELCEIYPQLPKEPYEFYIGFNSIGYELGLFNRRR
jgi:superfamily II DNA or RNA helicase